jgi:glutathione S-transferase
MRLYHHPMSLNARRAVMTAVHLDAPVELVFVDLAKGEQRKPEFLQKNLNGRVPVLEDGDFMLSESHAIMQYLADKTPGQSLYPKDLRARADVNRWLFWSAHHFTPAVSILNWETHIKPMIGAGESDPAAVQRGQMLVTETARVLDAHLAGKKWVVGDKLSLADFALATPLMVIRQAKLPVNDFANLMVWFRRVESQGAWKSTGPKEDRLPPKPVVSDCATP